MIIGIEASNIRTGGGKKHLEKFVLNSLKYFDKVSFVIISNNNVNRLFDNNNRIKCISNTLLNSNSFFSFLSQFFLSNFYFRSNKCDIVFVPGGIFLCRFRPYVTMSQNMLPFDKKELKNFGILNKLRFNLIKVLQKKTFINSEGVIFLTEFAKEHILSKINTEIKNIIIPHGIMQQQVNNYKFQKNNLNILYISDFLPYKHNLNVVKAVSSLIGEGYDISLTLIGSIDNIQYPKIKKIISSSPKLMDKIKILGKLEYEEIKKYFSYSSLFLFASTCENLPFIVLEAISYGMPVISSNKSPMKDMIYGDDIFFDSYDYNSIKSTITKNLDSEKLSKMSLENFNLSKKYLWSKNAEQTVNFLESNI